MQDEPIVNAVCKAFADASGQRTGPFTTIEDLKMDSLDYLDVLLVIEKQTGKRINGELAGQANTIADVIAAIQ